MRYTEYTYTMGMGEEEVAERLDAADVGVLSLVRGDEAVSFPAAHHYDGAHLYLRLCERPGSNKTALVDATGRASFVLTGGETGVDAWSVVVRGPLTVVEDELDDATVNSWFTPVPLFDEAVEDVVAVVYRMVVDDIGGRRSCGSVGEV